MKNGEYILVVAPDWYRGKRYRQRYCYEHHLVWEKVNGRPVPDGMVIHHKDGNKHNNMPDNLELTTPNEHTRGHSLKQGKSMALLICPYCKKRFTREYRNVKNYDKVCFCSRVCSGKFFSSHPTKVERQKAKEKNVLRVYKVYSGIV